MSGASETSEWVETMETDSRQLSRRAFIGTMSGALFGIRAFGQEVKKLPRSDGTQLRFGMIADAQYVDAEARGSRFYRNSLSKLEACVDDLNTQDLDFVIHLGDFIDRDFQSFDAILPIYEKLRAPSYHHHGNYGVRKGIHYVTLQGMVETESTTAYATLARTDPTWELKGRGREPDRRLS